MSKRITSVGNSTKFFATYGCFHPCLENNWGSPMQPYCGLLEARGEVTSHKKVIEILRDNTQGLIKNHIF